MAATETAARSRRSYVTITCPACGDSRVVNDRSARRIRAGQGDGRCQTCRTMARLQVTEVERAWARDMLAAMSEADRALVLLAFQPPAYEDEKIRTDDGYFDDGGW